jgi:hypothetical protein
MVASQKFWTGQNLYNLHLLERMSHAFGLLKVELNILNLLTALVSDSKQERRI